MINTDSVINGFKNTELGVFPKDWDVVELGNVLNEVDLRAEQIPNYRKLTILSLTKNFGLIPQSERFGHRVAIKDVRKYKVVKKNWIAYNPYVIWEGAIHSLKNRDIGLVSPVYVIWQCSLVNARYLDFILRTNLLIRQYEKYAAGAVNRRRSIKKNDFKKILIPLPSFPEQKKIAGLLSAVQEAKEKNEEVIKAAKELKKSLMKHVFRCGPVSFEKSEKVKLKETEIGIVPEDWEVVHLGDVADLIMGQSPPGISYNEIGNGMPFLQGKAEFKSIFPKSIKFTSKPLKIAPKGSVLISVRAPVGDANIANTDYCIGRGLAAIIVKNRQSLFLFYLLDYLKPFLEREGYGSTFKAINKQKLENFKILYPPITTQQKITDIFSGVDKKIEAEENKKKALEELFRSLLNNIMTGKIRVHNLDIEV